MVGINNEIGLLMNYKGINKLYLGDTLLVMPIMDVNNSHYPAHISRINFYFIS